MTARKLTALNKNGDASPSVAIATPASAGPMARLTLMPTLFKATADASSGRGTSCGTIACHAGLINAVPAPSATVNNSRPTGVMLPASTTSPKAAAMTVM